MTGLDLDDNVVFVCHYVFAYNIPSVHSLKSSITNSQTETRKERT
jgi:hypothetical protein